MRMGQASDMADEAQRKALVQHALRSESDGKLRAMVNLAKSEEGIPIAPDAFDRDPWLFNVENGTVDLRTGAISAHRPEAFLTKLAPVVYDPSAATPLFEAFLARIFAKDPAMVGYLQQALGYSLTGQTVEQCWFLLHGIGANGKSTLLRTIIDLLCDYATWTPTQTLLAKRSEAIDNDLARLRGARFVGATETDGGRRLAEELVKRLTGGDKVAARFLYGEFFECAPEFKLWLATNHKPEIRGTDHATWRRVRLVPFTVTIPDEEQDKQLLEKLRGEFPGILRWMVEGCLAWQRDGLRQPDAVTEATRTYRASMDVVGNFLAECCADDPHGTVKAADLYRAYLAWCDSGKEHAESQRKFGEVLRERGYSHGTRATGGATTWRGIRLGSEGMGERQDPHRAGRGEGHLLQHGVEAPAAGRDQRRAPVLRQVRVRRGALRGPARGAGALPQGIRRAHEAFPGHARPRLELALRGCISLSKCGLGGARGRGRLEARAAARPVLQPAHVPARQGQHFDVFGR
jgi:putative DNA primase/helicase